MISPFFLLGSRSRKETSSTKLTFLFFSSSRLPLPSHQSHPSDNRRQTIVIDKKGTVRKIFNSQFEVEKHVEAALEALKKL